MDESVQLECDNVTSLGLGFGWDLLNGSKLTGLNDVLLDHASRFRLFFYHVTPSEMAAHPDNAVPEYFVQSYWLTIVLIHLEEFYKFFTQKPPRDRWHDRCSSFFIMSLLMIVRGVLYPVVRDVYCWFYANYAIIHLAEDSWVTWLVAFLWIDFTYYWLHRWRHTVNILWADHQLHHSSEDYNLSNAYRISPIEYGVLFVYLAVVCAPIVPPKIWIQHASLSYLYQFLLHTELIPHLGAPLEWIFNTPSAHRVHHGRTLDCIDKNFGATLIIWDRLFGTFQSELDVTQPWPLRFGLVDPIKTFNAATQIFWYYATIWQRLKAKIENKWKVIFYPPGWRECERCAATSLATTNQADSSHQYLLVGDPPASHTCANCLKEAPLKIPADVPKFNIQVHWLFTAYIRLSILVHAVGFYHIFQNDKSAFTMTGSAVFALLDGAAYHLCITKQHYMSFISTVRCFAILYIYDTQLKLASPCMTPDQLPFGWTVINFYHVLAGTCWFGILSVEIYRKRFAEMDLINRLNLLKRVRIHIYRRNQLRAR